MQKEYFILPALLLILIISGLLIYGKSQPLSRKKGGCMNYENKRKEMVLVQLQGRDITDPQVLNAMMKVKRQKFIPDEYCHLAYHDAPIQIGKGQTISQPYIVALMTQSLKLKKDEKVLEIGTGSGYQAAVLSEITKQVYSVEIIPELARKASETLSALGYNNVNIKTGDGYKGWPEHAPFDAIIITAAIDHIPQPLIDQLKEGGRIILPQGDPKYYQLLNIIYKIKGKLHSKTITGVRFVPMTGEAQK